MLIPILLPPERKVRAEDTVCCASSSKGKQKKDYCYSSTIQKFTSFADDAACRYGEQGKKILVRRRDWNAGGVCLLLLLLLIKLHGWTYLHVCSWVRREDLETGIGVGIAHHLIT